MRGMLRPDASPVSPKEDLSTKVAACSPRTVNHETFPSTSESSSVQLTSEFFRIYGTGQEILLDNARKTKSTAQVTDHLVPCKESIPRQRPD